MHAFTLQISDKGVSQLYNKRVLHVRKAGESVYKKVTY
jgi:hypothetical protein